jgi:hypothetical protein
MNELKKKLIRQILESRDEQLLRLLLELMKPDAEPAHSFHPEGALFSNAPTLNTLEIQEGIDSFFNPSLLQKP